MDPAVYRGAHGSSSLQRYPWIQLVSELIGKSFKNIPRGRKSQECDSALTTQQECDVGDERGDIRGDSGLTAQQVDNAIGHVSVSQLSIEDSAVESPGGASAESQITPITETCNACLLYTSPSPRDS